MEKGDSMSPAFLVLDLSGKSVEAVTGADLGVLTCRSNTVFLGRRNGESCSFPTNTPCCGHQSFLWQFFKMPRRFPTSESCLKKNTRKRGAQPAAWEL